MRKRASAIRSCAAWRNITFAANVRTTLSRRPPLCEERKALRGDLDNSVLIALRKEPERRYASIALSKATLKKERRHVMRRIFAG